MLLKLLQGHMEFDCLLQEKVLGHGIVSSVETNSTAATEEIKEGTRLVSLQSGDKTRKHMRSLFARIPLLESRKR
jgi:hypothetical protein